MLYYVYVYLDPRDPGEYIYENIKFNFRPFYVGKGTGDRYLSHLRIANGNRKGKINLVISKIKSILSDGLEPIILKSFENLPKESYGEVEKYLIKLIGKSIDNTGTLLNITDGGDGGVTWVGQHHNKGKKLEEIVGEEKSNIIRTKLSEMAAKRTGIKNPNYGNRGDKNPIFGRKHTEEEIKKMSQSTLDFISKLPKEEILNRINHMNESKKNIPDEIKDEWYKKTSETLKERHKNGEIFTEERREKLRLNNYKKLKKGSEELKLSDDTKKKISEKLKGRILTDEHISKLVKCIPFFDFEIIIKKLIEDKIIKNITQYRQYAKENRHLKLPVRPEKSYKKYGWTNWRKYGL